MAGGRAARRGAAGGALPGVVGEELEVVVLGQGLQVLLQLLPGEAGRQPPDHHLQHGPALQQAPRAALLLLFLLLSPFPFQPLPEAASATPAAAPGPARAGPHLAQRLLLVLGPLQPLELGGASAGPPVRAARRPRAGSRPDRGPAPLLGPGVLLVLLHPGPRGSAAHPNAPIGREPLAAAPQRAANRALGRGLSTPARPGRLRLPARPARSGKLQLPACPSRPGDLQLPARGVLGVPSAELKAEAAAAVVVVPARCGTRSCQAWPSWASASASPVSPPSTCTGGATAARSALLDCLDPLRLPGLGLAPSPLSRRPPLSAFPVPLHNAQPRVPAGEEDCPQSVPMDADGEGPETVRGQQVLRVQGRCWSRSTGKGRAP